MCQILSLSYPYAALATLSALAVSGSALRWAARHAGPGAAITGATVAAVTATNWLLPLLFEATAQPTRGMVGFLAGWLASSKAIALYCGRGPLAAGTWSWPQFMALYALPVLPVGAGGSGRSRSDRGSVSSIGAHATMRQQPNRSSAGSNAGSNLAARTLAHSAVAVVALLCLVAWPPRLLRELCYVLAMYGWLGMLTDALSLAAHRWLGLHLRLLFHPPWQAHSIGAFWGATWNLAASDAVRTAVYEPLCEGSWVRRQPAPAPAAATTGTATTGPAAAYAGSTVSRARLALQPQQQRENMQRASNTNSGGGTTTRDWAALALCVACLTSGVLHEAIAWIISGETTRGGWLAFFTVQGPLILAERCMLSWLGHAGIKPPLPLRTAISLAVLFVTAHCLFFIPGERLPGLVEFVTRVERAFGALTGWLNSLM